MDNDKFQIVDNASDAALMQTIFGGASSSPAPAAVAPVAAPAPAPAPVEVTPPAPIAPETPAPVAAPAPLTSVQEAELDKLLFGGASAAPAATPSPVTPAAVPVAEPAATTPATSAAPATEPAKAPEATGDTGTKTQFYKAMAKQLISAGQWAPVNGLDEAAEIDDSTFADLVSRQDQYRLEQQWGQIKNSNEAVNSIIEYIEQGGDADKIIDVFKAQRDVQAMDFTTEAGQKQAIRQFYKDNYNWDDSRVNKHMAQLEIDGADALKDEATFVKGQWDTKFTQQRQDLLTQQQQAQQAAEAAKKQKMMNTVGVLREQKMPDKEIQNLLTKMYVNTHQTQDGKELTELDVKIMEMQSDPKQFLEFAQFVLNKEAYKKSLITTGKNTATANAFEALVIGTPAAKVGSTAQTASAEPTRQALEKEIKQFLNLQR